MTPIFIAIALTSPLKTKLVNSTAYLTSPLGCLPCISNLTYFNQNSWFLFLLQTGLSTKFPLLSKCYQHLLSFLGQILLLSLIPLFLSHFPRSHQQILWVIPSEYILSLTTYQYHHLYNPCLNNNVLSISSIISIVLHLIYMFPLSTFSILFPTKQAE